MLVLVLGALVILGAIYAEPVPPEKTVVVLPRAVVQRPPDETVVVLPSADGHTGTVVVQRGGERHVLNQPFAASRLTGGKAEITQLSDAEVRQSRSEEHTSELQSRLHLVCRLLLEKKKKTQQIQ